MTPQSSDDSNPPPRSPAPKQARRLGHYRFVKELASGGMGAVYDVVHEATGIHYALKTLLPEALGGESDELDRFRREAEVMAQLNHPAVVRIHTASLEGPTPFIVQGLLTGGTLKDRLKTRPLEIATAIGITVKLARGLAHCHERGVLHRDLKPSNVLFSDRNEPLLVDFGLALLVGAGKRLTQTGTVMGTPGYMAPEQALGLKDLDARTDVYGLGAVLYAMLTGRAPFVGRSLYAVLSAVANDPPEPPSTTRPEVPPWLEAVCLRAMAKTASDRFPSAAALADALERPGAAPTRGPAPKIAFAAAAVVASAAALALFLPAVESPRESPPNSDPAEHPRATTPDTVPSTTPTREFRSGPIPFPNANEARVLFTGDTLVAISDSGKIVRWQKGSYSPENAASLDPSALKVWPTDGESNTPVCLLDSGANEWIAATSGGQLCRVTKTETRARSDVKCVAVARRGTTLAVAHWAVFDEPSARKRRRNDELLLVAADSLETQKSLGSTGAQITALAFLSDGRLAVSLYHTASRKSELIVWDLEQATPQNVVLPFGQCRAIAVHGETVAVGSSGGQMLTFSAPPNRPLKRALTFQDPKAYLGQPHQGAIKGLAFSKDGATLFSVAKTHAEGKAELKSWDSATGKVIGSTALGSARPLNMVLDESGNYVAVGFFDSMGHGGTVEVVPVRRLLR